MKKEIEFHVCGTFFISFNPRTIKFIFSHNFSRFKKKKKKKKKKQFLKNMCKNKCQVIFKTTTLHQSLNFHSKIKKKKKKKKKKGRLICHLKNLVKIRHARPKKN